MYTPFNFLFYFNLNDSSLLLPVCLLALYLIQLSKIHEYDTLNLIDPIQTPNRHIQKKKKEKPMAKAKIAQGTICENSSKVYG